MNKFILFTILTVTTFPFFVSEGWLPSTAKLLPELLSGVAALIVILLGVKSGFRDVRPVYWGLFLAAALVFACGAIANSLDPGPIVAGMRTYLRAIPFFLLPLVYRFSEGQIRTQLRLLLLVCLVQFPLALEQRLHSLSRNNTSGDDAFGTFMTTGFATVVAVSCACIVTAHYLRGRMSLALFLLLLLATLAPTAVNETKAAFVLLPIGMLATYLVTAKRGKRLRNLATAVMALLVAGSVIVPTYNYFGVMREWGGGTVQDYFLDPERFHQYIFRDTTENDAGRPGRGTAVALAIHEMSRDPVNIAFGLGIGNASDSVLGPGFAGKYFDRYRAYLSTGLSAMLFEVGFFGVALVIAISYAIYRDARNVASRDPTSLISTLAAGWSAVTIVVTVAIGYVDHTSSAAITYLFWFFSGVIAGQRMRGIGTPQTPSNLAPRRA